MICKEIEKKPWIRPSDYELSIAKDTVSGAGTSAESLGKVTAAVPKDPIPR